jgi:hypothetical protein
MVERYQRCSREVVQIGVKPYIRPSKVDAKLHVAEPIELFGAKLPNFGSILINAECPYLGIGFHNSFAGRKIWYFVNGVDLGRNRLILVSSCQ